MSSDLLDTIDRKTADGLETLMETDTIKFEDGGMAIGLGMGGATVAAATSGDVITAAGAGIQSVAYIGASIGMGDYPGRAARPVYRMRDAGRRLVYDTIVADRLADDIDLTEIDATYPDTDIEDAVMAQYDTDTKEEATERLKDDLIEAGRNQYIDDPSAFEETDAELLAGMTLDAIPDFRFNDDVDLAYTNEDLDPYDIKEELLTRFGDFLQDELGGQREQRIEEGLGLLEGTYPLEDEYLETMHDDAWDGEVQSQEDLYEAVLHDMAFQGRSIAHTRDEAFQDELEGRFNAVNRFEETAALDHLDEHEYEVYEVEDPETIATMNAELGTCKRNYGKTNQTFQEWAWEDDTTILGFRRDDSDEWAGFTRNYSLQTDDGRDILAVDTWEMPYKDGREGGNPDGACDFENYGDVLPVQALASIQYGLENDYDFVVAGHSDGRVKDAREVNPGRDTKMFLDGLGDLNTRYGLGLTTNQTVHVLMEDDFSDYRS
jgi:hypothetical protein